MDKPDEFLGDRYRVRWTEPLRADVYRMAPDERREDEPTDKPVARLKVRAFAGPVQYDIALLHDGEFLGDAGVMTSGEIVEFLNEALLP